MMMNDPSEQRLQFLLLQIRDPDDPIREHEIRCFANALECPETDILVHDLIHEAPNTTQFREVDAVLIGGSGKYSVASGGPWLPAALEAFQFLYDETIPTFASCWGFQAFARALGGRVVTDLKRAELGTLSLTLTQEGMSDPLFRELGSPFWGQLGHQDIVDELPDTAIRLASSERVENEAFTFANKPIYATQFHPEMTREDLLRRMEVYPEYLTKITGMSVEEFRVHCHATPQTTHLLRRFAQMVAEQRF